MSLKHPQKPPASTRDLAVDPMLTMDGNGIPRHRIPSGETPPEVAYQIVHDELMLDGNARMNLATFVTTWMDPQAQRLMAESFDKNMIDKDEYPQTAELESRCVEILSRLWHAPDATTRDRLLHHRVERGGDARRPRPEATVAAGAARGGQARRPPEPRDGHQRPGLLGEVRELLGRRDAPRADGGRALPPLRRGGREALRREHDRRRRDPRLHVRRLLRAGRGDLRRARRPAGSGPASTSPCTSTAPPARSSRRSSTPTCLGLRTAARLLDQRVGPQVRARLPRRRLDRVARRRRAARRPDLLGQLPRRQHADLRAQLLPTGRAGRRAVLQLPAPRLRRLRQGAGLRARRRDPPVGGDRAARPVPRCSPGATSCPCSPSR